MAKDEIINMKQEVICGLEENVCDIVSEGQIWSSTHMLSHCYVLMMIIFYRITSLDASVVICLQPSTSFVVVDILTVKFNFNRTKYPMPSIYSSSTKSLKPNVIIVFQ